MLVGTMMTFSTNPMGAHAFLGPTHELWVEIGGVGNGTTEGNAAGNITYVLTTYAGQLANHTIKVKPGTYNATTGETFPLVINHTDANMTLLSTGGAATTVIDAGADTGIIHVQAPNATIGGVGTGFTITNNWATAPNVTGYNVGYGILVCNTTGSARGAKIQGNTFHVKGNAISLCSTANSTQADKAQILDNTFEVGYSAVRVSSQPGGNLVQNIEILRNNVTAMTLAPGDPGLLLESAANATITDNNFTDCDTALIITANNNSAIGVTATASDFNVSGNTFTNCTRGVLIYPGTSSMGGPCTISHVNMTGNTLNGGDEGIWIRNGTDGAIDDIIAHYNNVYNHSQSTGVRNDFTTTNVNATHNWWGDVSGPGGVGGGAGDHVSANVTYSPWLNSTHPGGSPLGGTGKSQAISGSGTLDATAEADITVDVTGTGGVDVGAVKYDGNPTGTNCAGDMGKYFDVNINTTTGLTSLTLKFYYTNAEIAAAGRSQLRVYILIGGTWTPCTHSGYHSIATGPYGGYVAVTVTATSTPSLDDLAGSPFGTGSVSPVGGTIMENEPQLLTTWIGAAAIAIAAAATITIRKRRR